MTANEQLEFQMNWEPVSNEGVKLPGREAVAEDGPASTGGNLTNGENMDLLEAILDPVNIAEACAKVKANKGAAGIDRVSVNELDGYMEVHWSRIADEIRVRTYKPSPVKRVEIPKPQFYGYSVFRR